MAAEIDLVRWRESAQVETVGGRFEKRRLGEIVLGGDGLHHRVIEPVLERTDGGGIALEETLGEGVDVKQTDACWTSLSSGDGVRAGAGACQSALAAVTPARAARLSTRRGALRPPRRIAPGRSQN